MRILTTLRYGIFDDPERVKGLTAVTDFGARGDAVTETDGSSAKRVCDLHFAIGFLRPQAVTKAKPS